TPQRLVYNMYGVWALGVLPSPNTPSNIPFPAPMGWPGSYGGDATFIIAGLASRPVTFGGGTHTVPPARGIITPFLFDVDIDFDIYGTNRMQSSTTSATGMVFYPVTTTGDPAFINNAYGNLGRGGLM